MKSPIGQEFQRPPRVFFAASWGKIGVRELFLDARSSSGFQVLTICSSETFGGGKGDARKTRPTAFSFAPVDLVLPRLRETEYKAESAMVEKSGFFIDALSKK